MSIVNGKVDGEEVLDEVAGGVDVACRELDKVASDEVLTELWRGWKSLCLQMASSCDEDADRAPARMEELVLADGFKLLLGRECVRACEMRLCVPS